MRKALITGSAGFIGFFLCRLLLRKGWSVVGVDCMSNYYDVKIKEEREKKLMEFQNFRPIHSLIEEPGLMKRIFDEERGCCNSFGSTSGCTLFN